MSVETEESRTEGRRAVRRGLIARLAARAREMAAIRGIPLPVSTEELMVDFGLWVSGQHPEYRAEPTAPTRRAS